MRLTSCRLFDLLAKELQLLREVLPRARRVDWLWDGQTEQYRAHWADVVDAAGRLVGLQVTPERPQGHGRACERIRHRFGVFRGQWVEPELSLVGLAAPAVGVLGAVIHEQEHPIALGTRFLVESTSPSLGRLSPGAR